MGQPEPIKLAIIKKCPNLLRVYGNTKLKVLKGDTDLFIGFTAIDLGRSTTVLYNTSLFVPSRRDTST